MRHLCFLGLTTWFYCAAQAYHYPPPSLKDDNYKWFHSAYLFRHTLRAPQAFTEYLPEINPSLFPRGPGYATEKGVTWAVQVGQSLKERFGDFIGDQNPRKCFARASETDRCYETTAGILEHLFNKPGFDNALINPVPIMHAPPHHDKYVATCGVTKVKDWSEWYNRTGFPSGRFENIGEFMSYIRKKANLPDDFTDEDVFLNFIDGAEAAHWNGNKLPDWMLEIYQDIEWASGRLINSDSAFGVDFPYKGRQLALGIADRLEDAVKGGKIWTHLSLFGYHDASVQAIRLPLNPNTDNDRVNFIGGLFFDLFRNVNNESDIQVLVSQSKGLIDAEVGESNLKGKKYQVPQYNAVEYAPIKKLKIKHCSNPCPLNKMTVILRKMYVKGYKAENCGCTGDNAFV